MENGRRGGGKMGRSAANNLPHGSPRRVTEAKSREREISYLGAKKTSTGQGLRTLREHQTHRRGKRELIKLLASPLGLEKTRIGERGK